MFLFDHFSICFLFSLNPLLCCNILVSLILHVCTCADIQLIRVNSPPLSPFISNPENHRLDLQASDRSSQPRRTFTSSLPPSAAFNDVSINVFVLFCPSQEDCRLSLQVTAQPYSSLFLYFRYTFPPLLFSSTSFQCSSSGFTALPPLFLSSRSFLTIIATTARWSLLHHLPKMVTVDITAALRIVYHLQTLEILGPLKTWALGGRPGCPPSGPALHIIYLLQRFIIPDSLDPYANIDIGRPQLATVINCSFIISVNGVVTKNQEAEALKKKNDANRKLIFNRAKKYSEEYEAQQKELIQLKRKAQLKGEFYVSCEAKMLFIIRIRGYALLQTVND
ncbi:unnamed protein product [Lactuca saligna]|uniref:Large ribosomal subunit protein uL30 N-terminal eukaryotes domain-containing protein n=1 Tax=Lactuca saligna TaxID=75948 RepID=A0AA35XYL3_LACSI|nr:unnamed protein product [Lactuca saligna]